MKYIVTGGAGFIGSHIVDRLVDDGNEVIIIDNESAESHDQFYHNNSAKYYKYDICDYDIIAPLFEDVDTVFHLAAESRIQPTIINPTQAVKTNTFGTCNVLQTSRENNVRRFVYSSTASAYGTKNSIPNKETQIENCLNPYSVSKVSGEKLCTMYYELYGLETIMFRYFNVYGERQPIRGQYAPVVGKFIEQNLIESPLTIVGDGKQKRDFVNVKDVVEANILASTVQLDELFQIENNRYERVDYGEVINIGTGKNHTIKEIATMISDYHINIEERSGELQESLSCINKAKSVLNWTPKVKLEDWIQSQQKEIKL
jgi:UDP-glucose 4-epimerase